MNLKSNKAITLVALIITIIILLILAGVSLSMVLGENGLINKAQSSVDKYKDGSENEQNLLNQIEEYLDGKGLGPSISNTESYVGKYADLTDLNDEYTMCLQGWLLYLKSGRTTYMDYVHKNDDIEKLLEEIEKFY